MRIRILTYNIHRAIGLDRRYRPGRILDVVEHHEPDIVFLQEVDEGAPRSREMDMAHWLAQQLGYPHLTVGHNVMLRRGRYGNATFARWPILAQENVDLTVGKKKSRGCLHSTVAVPVRGGHRELHLFNLHLGLSAKERIQQLGILNRADAMRQLDHDVPCILGGDFNDWRSQLEPILVDFLGFRCITRRPRGTLRTYPSISPTGPLDRLYLRGPLRALTVRGCRLAVSRVASDHLPVIADIDMQTRRKKKAAG